MVARARRCSVSERRRRRRRTWDEGRRTGDREGEGRRVRCRLTGSVPIGPCKWNGSIPATSRATDSFHAPAPLTHRPLPPPASDCRRRWTKRRVVVTPRTFVTNYKAFYWQSPEGLNPWVYRYPDKWMVEDRLDKNPPRAARAYALIAAVMFDAFIASQESKSTDFWYIRPSQLDTTNPAGFPGAESPELPVEPRDVFQREGGSPCVSLPDPSCCGPSTREGKRRLARLGRHPLPHGHRSGARTWANPSRHSLSTGPATTGRSRQDVGLQATG